MTALSGPCDDRDERLRVRLAHLLAGIHPFDELERAHLGAAAEWAASGAPLCRTEKPDVPPMHLVSYFAVLDGQRRRMLLTAHRKAGLWLPPGGHVEPGEDPWDTVVRECREELHVPAVASAVTGERPFFLMVAPTQGQGGHTDVSLWYVVEAEADSVTAYDEREFAAIRWPSLVQVLDEPLSCVDPHLHRFVRKLRGALAGRPVA